jgi:signal transduction histidine kinase
MSRRALIGKPPKFHAESGLSRLAKTKRTTHIADIRVERPYLEGNPVVVALSDRAGARTLLLVPMLKENELLGAICIYRDGLGGEILNQLDLLLREWTNFLAVLLNLISNGFYAATKRKAEADGGNYEPTLAAATKNLGDSIEIRIRDNGTGIPPEVKEKLFNPFF